MAHQLVSNNKHRATYQALPGILVQEAHRNIERGTSPHLQTVCIGKSPAGLLCDVEHFDRPETGSKEGLVRIAPRCVHDERTGVFAHRLCESFGTVVDDDIAPSDFARIRCVEGWTIGVLAVLELGGFDILVEAWVTCLTLDGASVDSEVPKICE